MFINKTVVSSMVAVATMMPVSVFAASSWSVVTVSQSQSANAPYYADISQRADIKTSTIVDGQAAASSHVVGNQDLWFTGSASQSQELTSASKVEWEKDKWPSSAKADSIGTVEQWQEADGKRIGKENQTAGVWLDTNIGTDKSHVEAGIGQNMVSTGGYGHQSADQEQFLGAAAHSEGYINPPRPSSWCSNTCSNWGNWGANLVSEVTVNVRSFFSF